MKRPIVTPKTRVFFLLIATILGVCGCGGPRFAYVNVQKWDCGAGGDNVTATLRNDGTLIVSGAGAMQDYDGTHVLTPWRNVKDSITGVTIQTGVVTVGRGAFGDCSRLTAITIPNSVTSIGDFAFAGSASVSIPGSVVSIGANAFARTAFIVVAANNPNYSSVNGVLFNKAKTVLIQYPQSKQDSTYVIPNSVASIANEAFANCGNLANVTIGSNVTAIGEFAFAFCPGITAITIPGNVTRIGEGAFAHSGLTAVTSFNLAPPETIGKGPFLNVTGKICLYIPESSSANYRSANHWKDFECIKVVD